MWMMGYNEGGEVYLPTTNNDSFSGSNRKLRPLIPRPPPPLHHRHLPNSTSNPPNTHHHHHHHHHQGHGVHNADHFLTLNHHLATMAEQSKREFNMAAQQVVVSSRWNPTPEQLRTLEELWRHGTRTPSADEIQQITSRLRRYGKIEGKNVFYWFQNHKARERQKRRRQMESSGGCPEEDHDHLNDHCETGKLGYKEAGGSYKTASEDVRRSNNDTPNINNNWESAIEKGGKLAGGSASASSSSASSSSVVTSLWMKKLNDNNSTRELLLHPPNSNIFSISGCCCCDDNDNVNVPFDRRNAAWHHLTITPPSSFSSCQPLPTSAGSLIVTVPPETASRSSSPDSSSPLPSQDFQTLQLFPLRSCCDGEEDYIKGFGGRRDDDDDDEENVGMGFEFASNCHVDHHHQFFEFLPLKN